MAEKAVTSTVARKAARGAISSRSVAVRSILFGSPRFAGPSQAVDFAPLAIIGCSFLGAHPRLLQGAVIVFRGVSLVTGDLNAFRVLVDRKLIRRAGD